MAVRLSALRAGRALPPRLISVRGWVDPRTIVRLEGLGQFKKIHLIGTRTRDLPACSIVPQPTTVPRAPWNFWYSILFKNLWSHRHLELQIILGLGKKWQAWVGSANLYNRILFYIRKCSLYSIFMSKPRTLLHKYTDMHVGFNTDENLCLMKSSKEASTYHVLRFRF
jgi:hypothetical protein